MLLQFTSRFKISDSTIASNFFPKTQFEVFLQIEIPSTENFAILHTSMREIFFESSHVCSEWGGTNTRTTCFQSSSLSNSKGKLVYCQKSLFNHFEAVMIQVLRLLQAAFQQFCADFFSSLKIFSAERKFLSTFLRVVRHSGFHCPKQSTIFYLIDVIRWMVIFRQNTWEQIRFSKVLVFRKSKKLFLKVTFHIKTNWLLEENVFQ